MKNRKSKHWNKILFVVVQIIAGFRSSSSYASVPNCVDVISPRVSVSAEPSYNSGLYKDLRKKINDMLLNTLAFAKGIPKYAKQIEALRLSGRFREYKNFAEMGLAEIGIGVRYSQSQYSKLNNKRPLIVVANHPLGVADGLALHYLIANARADRSSLIYLARWVEKLFPNAIFEDNDGWGTAVPVEINLPHPGDPHRDSKIADINYFNMRSSRVAIRVLRMGGSIVIFPAGHVASMEKDSRGYPHNVYDSPNSWNEGVLNLARMGEADLLFAHIDAVNSESFYKNRKRFGGGDKERVIWFLSETLAMSGKSLDVRLSDPMNLETMYETLSGEYGYEVGHLKNDLKLTAELMRRFTYKVAENYPQKLDTEKFPIKKSRP